jgi:uncharacterized membrane protein YhfC
MNLQKQATGGAPGFYRFMAFLFFLLGGIFVWQAVKQHSWFFGAFGAITIVNGFMSVLRSLVPSESKQ